MLKVAPIRTRHLAPGDKLGKYEVIRQIAIGGMAEIYLARTLGIEGFEKLVVLKRILPQYVSHASFVEMFLNEARLAATLHHVNIAQVYDIGLEDGDYFFAMEYVHGEDLDHIAMASEEQGVPLSMDASLTLVSGLCAGLHYAHERTSTDGKPMGIVHRDVSPSNVIVSYDGAIKLVDFGIARASSRPGTTQGGLKGKISYMSPEQCRAKAQLDRRSDIYSVGTILYELTTGKLPFAGETEYQVLNQIVNEDVPPPSAVVPGYPATLERIVLRALARDPDQRYATAHELQTDVEEFAHETRLRVSPLVLARLMGTLFPARLEEWDQAKTQGGFFLEQHVVKTLIESGKAPDPAQSASASIDPRRQAFGVDDEQTALGVSSFAELTDTAVGAAPILEPERSDPGAVPLPPPPPRVEAALPDPRPPNPYPMVTELMSATPGALVTSQGKYGGVPAAAAGRRADDTERVRLRQRRASSPTAFVRTPPRTPIIALVALLVAGAAVAAFIALRPGAAPAAAPAVADPPRQQMRVVPAPAPPVDVGEPSPARPPPVVEPPVAEPPVEPKVTARKPAVKKPAPPPPRKPVVVKPKPRPVPKKPQPKEATWNADSPFMPVRQSK